MLAVMSKLWVIMWPDQRVNSLMQMCYYLSMELTTEQIIQKVIITTGTLYTLANESDRVRAELAKRTIKKARELGYNILVIDSGSPPELVEEFMQSGAIVYTEVFQSVGKSKRKIIRSAHESEKEVIVLIEPEKEQFLQEIPKLVLPILKGEADMVIPKRNSLASYPLAQQYSEQFGNTFFKELTKMDLDIFFGPRIFTQDMTSYFLNYDGRYNDNWDALYIPVIDAIHEGKKLLSVNVDYTHPQEQTAIEEHDLRFYFKRLDELHSIMNALSVHWERLHAASSV